MSVNFQRNGSVTHWIGEVQEGDREVKVQLWSRYLQRLAMLARKRLNAARRVAGAVDEEDVELSVLNSLWFRNSLGQLPEVRGRDEFWRLLVLITAHKVLCRIRSEARQRRGGGRMLDEAGLSAGSDNIDVVGQFVIVELTHELVVMIAEVTARKLASLPEPTFRQMAAHRMARHTDQEIVARNVCVARSVERKPDVIRSLWSTESGP